MKSDMSSRRRLFFREGGGGGGGASSPLDSSEAARKSSSRSQRFLWGFNGARRRGAGASSPLDSSEAARKSSRRRRFGACLRGGGRTSSSSLSSESTMKPAARVRPTARPKRRTNAMETAPVRRVAWHACRAVVRRRGHRGAFLNAALESVLICTRDFSSVKVSQVFVVVATASAALRCRIKAVPRAECARRPSMGASPASRTLSSSTRYLSM